MATAQTLNYQSYINPRMPLVLPDLPFDREKLFPAISKQTFDQHHGQHHKGYIEKANKLAAEAGLKNVTLEALIAATENDLSNEALRNSALQCWNHGFQWQSLAEAADVAETPAINTLIMASFGSLEKLAERAVAEAMAHFGSGWLWLLAEKGALTLTTTHDASRPRTPEAALLVIDLWEHAYYLDHQSRKGDYISAIVHKHWNWRFAEHRLEQLNS